MKDPITQIPAPEDIPIPEDDELFAEDYWIVKDKHLIRRHVKPRTTSFRPTDPDDCPINMLRLLDERQSVGFQDKGKQWSKTDDWVNCVEEWKMETSWTGATIFFIDQTPEQDHQQVETSEEEPILTVEPNQCWEIEIFLTEHDEEILRSDKTEDHWGLIATAAKRQRAEVKIRNLTDTDQSEFRKAQSKEIDQWLDTGTVRRICRSLIPEQNIMQCRWIHTWKELDAVEKAELGKSRKAKSRIVVLGYQDPNIEDIPRDSPTMHKETRSLLLQMCASRAWVIRSFDVKTAFLRGSKRDTRTLGIEPVPEMRDRMRLQDSEVCELLKSAYGLVNAPYLWYEELKESLCSLGFIMCPMDPCLFVLPDAHQGIHGVIGMHVDDGLCAGDREFDKVLQKLEAKFPFGSKREKEFTFTGIQIRQDKNGKIHLSQKNYVENIDPICINRDRRKKDTLIINDDERQNMRGLIGSLQYAATNTRPDIAARLSFLQSKITCATIKDLHECNRLLADAKRYSQVEIIISPIAEADVRFVTYSDASFATREKQQSQKGCMVLVAHKDIIDQKEAIASPMSWHSKKINRVVASTLAAETYALSHAVDSGEWLRLLWHWMKFPSLNWKQPEISLRDMPASVAVVDCKSLYDVITKNTMPQCQEHRTLLEALVIKDRVKHGIKLHWVHSAAQIADPLTKVMDCQKLRDFLQSNFCCLHDIQEVLKERADKKTQKSWLQQLIIPKQEI